MAVGRDRRQATEATHGVDGSVGANGRRGGLAARPEVDRPQNARFDAADGRLEREERTLRVGSATVGAEADVDGAVVTDRGRGVPGRATRGMKTPACRQLVAGADRIAQREQRAAVQADIRGSVGGDRGRALDVRAARHRVGNVRVAGAEPEVAVMVSG